MKKVSVVIPTYNSSRWIKSCIKSVVEQTYTNLEIIVSDDESTDDTLDIVREFDDDRIKIVTSTHGGDAKTRTVALKVATGDYLLFVDSDDAITPDRVSTLVEAIEKDDKLLFVVTSWVTMDESGNITGIGYMPPQEKYKLFVQCRILFGGSLHRREGFGLFDESFPVYSDWFKLCWLLERGEYLALEHPFYLRRVHKDSLSQSYLGDKQRQILKYRRIVWHRFRKEIPKKVWETLNTGKSYRGVKNG